MLCFSLWIFPCGVFGAYILRTRKRQIVRYRLLLPSLFLRTVLVIWEQRDLLPDAYVSTMCRAACIMVLLYHFPFPALCGLCPVRRIPYIGGCCFREALMEELQLLRLLVYLRIDPEIAHIRIPAVAAVVHYGVRIIRELQPGPSVVIKGFPCLSLHYRVSAFLCDIP